VDLSKAQWDRLQIRLQTSYDLQPGMATVCAVFEQGVQQDERHVEMPIQMFATLMVELANLNRATAVLTPDALPDHLEEARNAADPARTKARHPSRTGGPAQSMAKLEEELLDSIPHSRSMEGPNK
jgi:hypothetical protein